MSRYVHPKDEDMKLIMSMFTFIKICIHLNVYNFLQAQTERVPMPCGPYNQRYAYIGSEECSYHSQVPEH